MSEHNPLTPFFRQTKISVKLPSKGRFYPEGYLELNNDGELDIKAMTATDELTLKNPDALLNGQGMIDVMKSCAPGIKGDGKALLIPDVSVIMLGIRHATEGDNMPFKATCPKCKTMNEYDRSIRSSFDYMEFLEDQHIIELNSKIRLELRPHSFQTSTKNSLAQFEQTKILQLLEKDNVTDDERLRSFGQSFEKMVSMNFDLVEDSIVNVTTPEGHVVTDKKFIHEFVKELEKEEVDEIRDHIRRMNTTGVPTSQTCVCGSCENEWIEEGIQYDPSHFFV